ncbi:alpha-L-fucosidase [Granulicella paludicola]|uniref:alpha-L-fucosidase n=1 Tax=Granulicella paludicola TaxID=474951 RepID=UPI0021E05C61|nr:alpha-L-fucosidase [Granulicella paludicola]
MARMKAMTRREALMLLGSATAAMATRGIAQQVTAGKYSASRESLKSYVTPDWFGDAKFGIWSHWGPQSAVGDGDWYARNMYREGSDQYEYHVKRFGPQSKVGYKDLIKLYTADKWDPEHLMDQYQKAGAKYFFSMGVHHDGFDLWNSKYQPRWNAVASGPKRDVVGEWAAAARKRGMRFGVSEHLSNSFEWLAPSHLADTKGPYAGVPYDGQNPAFADLYHDYSKEPAGYAESIKDNPMGRNEAPDWWKLQYFNRVKDLVDQHQPDLLYTDGGIPFEAFGEGTVAELYNVGPLTPEGKTAAVYFSKTRTDCEVGTCLLDRERGVLNDISPVPWQTDTCIGEWHYKVGAKYKSAKKVIDLLVDIVSKNGNLLLNFPLPASGELDAEEQKTLAGITEWMAVNGEGVFSTRPWKIFGEGPATKVVVKSNGQEFDPNEGKKPDLGAKDIRFTTKGETLYAFVQGWPEGELVIESLALEGPQRPMKAVDVRLLGRDEALRFTHDAKGLRVTMPGAKPATADVGIGLRVRFV